MPKKIKLIDLTKLKKSHHLFMKENAHIIKKAEQHLKDYENFTNEIGYTAEVKQKLQEKFISEGKHNQINEVIAQEKHNLEQAIAKDIKKHKRMLQLTNNLLKH